MIGVTEERVEYFFTFRARKRSKPNPRYEGILKTHRFYIEYYSLLSGQTPIQLLVNNSEPRIVFPAKFTEALVSFAEELGGKIIEVRKVKPPRASTYYEKPVVVLPSEIAFRRHLLFSLVTSTYRKPEKLNMLRSLILNLNANFLNILTTIALERYSELRSRSDPTWHWYMMRVGRAVKVLYKLD